MEILKVKSSRVTTFSSCANQRKQQGHESSSENLVRNYDPFDSKKSEYTS